MLGGGGGGEGVSLGFMLALGFMLGPTLPRVSHITDRMKAKNFKLM